VPTSTSSLSSEHSQAASIGKDLIAGTVVFLVALPLCLGIALASGAPLFSGILAGVVGGIVVGWISGSHTSVTGPAAGLTAIVAVQIEKLGSFEAFLVAVLFAGLIQIAMGLARFGFIAAFFPSSVIKGLLAAIGVILIIKQTPYIFGLHNGGEATEMAGLVGEVDEVARYTWHWGATALGVASILFLQIWDRTPRLKKSVIPAPLLVVLAGVAVYFVFAQLGARWAFEDKHLVRVPVASNFREFIGFLYFPDFSVLFAGSTVYLAAVTVAIVASLETLLNLEAVDNLDPRRRSSPPSRELFAQGVGNTICGLIGGLPVTAVIVRGSVNISAGAQSKLSAIFHGFLLAGLVILLPQYLNLIPLASLAAILIVTGFKLASPVLIKNVYLEGRYQFIPFIVTLVGIVVTDLLAGILIGLAVSLLFILYSNYRRPLKLVIERHLGGDVHHLELANQVSFLNRGAMERVFRSVPRGGQLFIDARNTDYIDPDIASLIRDYIGKTAPVKGVTVSVLGLHDQYRQIRDVIEYVDYSTSELQRSLKPIQVLEILREGNRRFSSGHPLRRDVSRQVSNAAQGQYPMAVVMSCMDSRTPAEMIFDLGLGDILNVCLAGNAMVGPRVLGSAEYGCVVAGAKLIVIMAHTDSQVMRSAIEAVCNESVAGLGDHFPSIIEAIRPSMPPNIKHGYPHMSEAERSALVDQVAQEHARKSIEMILEASSTIRDLVARGEVGMVAAMYDTRTGVIEFLSDSAVGIDAAQIQLSAPGEHSKVPS
jgi:carbonic anhydrase